MSIVISALLMIASADGGATSTEPAPAAPQVRADATQAESDPMVCQSSTEIGSRLKRRRVCMHKSEWDRQKHEDKQMIDRTQVLRGMVPAG